MGSWCPPMDHTGRMGAPLLCQGQAGSRGAGQRSRSVLECPGLGVPVPRSPLGLQGWGRGKGPSPRPEPLPVPAPSDGEVALPLPALTRGFLRPRLCPDPRPAWLCRDPHTGTGGCQEHRAAVPQLPHCKPASPGRGSPAPRRVNGEQHRRPPIPTPAGSRLQGPRGPQTQSGLWPAVREQAQPRGFLTPVCTSC